MIKNHFWIGGAVAVTLAACLSDGGTEIPNELTGNLYLSGGSAAVHAQVTLFPVDYLPGRQGGTAKQTAYTDGKGRFSFSGMKPGQYNLVGKLGATDSLFCFLDSLQVSGKTLAPADTLKLPGSVSGKIQLDTTDDPRTVTVQVVGTDYFGLVDSSGLFVLKNVPQGDYELRVITTLPDYAPAVKQVTVQSGQSDTLGGVTSVHQDAYSGYCPVTVLR